MVKIINPIQKQKSIRNQLLFSQDLDIESLAWQTGFYQRPPKKITATNLFSSFWLMCTSSKNKLSSWAINLSKLTGKYISEQALNERLSESVLDLSKAIIKHSLDTKLDKAKIKKSKQNHKKLLAPFNRILIRDSTVQQINSSFHKEYPGSHSNGQTPTSLIRIQALYDYTNEKWDNFDFTAYTDNDQKAAPTIGNRLQKRDLLLQDLGYYSLDWIEQVIENQYIITKWDNKTYLYNIDRVKIDLLKLLKGKRRIDMDVLVGKDKKLPMRLVIKKLPKHIASDRRAKARENRHSKSNHSAEYFKLLGYEIYLTNVPQTILSLNDVVKLYGLRWHIEILFKSWKSFDNFKSILKNRKMKIERLRFMVYAILIKLIWVKNVIYQKIKDKGKAIFERPISELKFIDTVNDLLKEILMITHYDQLDIWLPIFKNHALYDKHTKRQNTKEKYMKFNKLCI